MVKVQSGFQTSGATVSGGNSAAAENFGKCLAEAMMIKGMTADFKECGINISKKGMSLKESMKDKTFMEAFTQGNFKEDLTTTNGSGAYAKLLHKAIITKAYENLQDVLDAVIVFDDLKNSTGAGSLQIPIGQPTIAYEVAEGQVINRFDEGISEITIVPRPVAAGTAITWRMTKRALPSVMQWILNNASNAVYRKVMKDIIDGITGTAGNTQSGFDAEAYDTIIDAERKVNSATDSTGIPYGFEATHLFLSYAAEATLRKSQDWKNHVQYAVAIPGAQLAVNRNVQYFGRLKMFTNPFISGNDRGFVLDKNYAVAYVPESDVESFEGQIPGRPYDKEVALLISVGQATLYTKAICMITL
jgi:hypothetical protein